MNWSLQVKAVGILAIIIGLIGFFYYIYEAGKGDLISMTGGLGILLLLLISVLFFLFISGGVGLLKHKNWGRQIILTFLVFGLVSMPYQIASIQFIKAVGISFGIMDYLRMAFSLLFIIWALIVLFNKDVRELFGVRNSSENISSSSSVN